jgi:hypothetical protein
MRSTGNSSRKANDRLLAPPRVNAQAKTLRGKALLDWLKRQGAEPIPAKERARLREAGFWGMPQE